MKELIAISIGSIFINNVILAQFLGLCPFIGVSKKMDSVMGMGLAVIFVLTLSSFITFVIYKFILVPVHIEYLKIITFILVIAALVQFVEIVLKNTIPVLYNALGIYLPLITTNCAVLGVAVLNVEAKIIVINEPYNIYTSILHGFMIGVSFLFALFLMATIREKLDLADIPKPFKGIPIAFITAGLMALAFFAADKTMLNFLK